MKLKLDDLPSHIKALNPHVFHGGPVAGIPAPKPEHVHANALVRPKPRAQEGQEGAGKGPRWLVTLVVHRGRVLDVDNLVGGLKPLRDVIAEHLGTDDAERFIRWEYHQIKTKGAKGVVVKVQPLAKKGEKKV